MGSAAPWNLDSARGGAAREDRLDGIALRLKRLLSPPSITGKDLEGDLPVQAAVFGQVDFAKPASA